MIPTRSGVGFQHEADERIGGAAAPAGSGNPKARGLKQPLHILDTAADEADSRGGTLVRVLALEGQRG